MEGDLGIIRRFGQFGTEINVSGRFGESWVAKSRLDSVFVSQGDLAADIVEGKLRPKMDKIDIAQAAITVMAVAGDEYYGQLLNDCRYYFCYGNAFRLMCVDIMGMLSLKEYLVDLAVATLGYLDVGGERQRKSPRKNKLKGEFTMAYENVVDYGWQFFNPVS